MYVRAEDWRAAHRVAVGCMPPDEIRELYVAQVTLPFLVTSLCLHSAMLKTFTTKKTFSRKESRLARHSRQLLCDFFKSLKLIHIYMNVFCGEPHRRARWREKGGWVKRNSCFCW